MGLATTWLGMAEIRAQTTVCDAPGLAAAVAAGGSIGFGCDGTIVLPQTLVIAQDTQIDGTGHTVTLSGNNQVRVFYVNPGVHFTLRNLTVANGSYLGTNGVYLNRTIPVTALNSIPENAAGGGLYNNGGVVTILNCQFNGNSVIGGMPGYGITSQTIDGGAAGGGAIWNQGGVLNLTNSSFTANSAQGGQGMHNASQSTPYYTGTAYGGAIGSTNGLINADTVSFAGNYALPGGWLNGTIVVQGNPNPLTFQNNKAVCGPAGGGACSFAGDTVTLVHCLFGTNWVTTPVLTNAVNYRTIANMVQGGAIYQAAGTLNLTDCRLTGNAAVGSDATWYASIAASGLGGALYSQGVATVSYCNFTGNLARGGSWGESVAGAAGGAIGNAGQMWLLHSVLMGNSALGGTGGMPFTGFGSLPMGLTWGMGAGGGICNSNSLVLVNVTLANNTANGGRGANRSDGAGPGNNNYLAFAAPTEGGRAVGAGIYNLGTGFGTNVTLTGNAATGGAGGMDDPGFPSFLSGGGLGGGVGNAAGVMTLVSTTLASNGVYTNVPGVGLTGPQATIALGGNLYASTNGTISLLATLLANSPSGSNVFGPVTDLGYNLSSDASAGFAATGSVNGVNPLLGTLGNYGGPVPTMPLLPGSPAIDAGGSGAGCATTDARGVPRPSGTAFDIGAFEFNGAYPPVARGGAGQPNAVFQVNVAGAPGQSMTLHTSTDLANWQPVATGMIPGGGMTGVTVTNRNAGGGQFFRAVLQ